MPKDLLSKLDGPEIIVGLAAPIGTDTKFIANRLSIQLERYNYASSYIRITDSLRSLNIEVDLIDSPTEKRYASYIDAGNWLREKLDLQDVFAYLAAMAISKARQELTGDVKRPAVRHAYIISQFKRPEEIRTMRRIYGSHFILLSIHKSRPSRVDHLSHVIAESHHQSGNSERFRSTAETLVYRDEEEEEERDYGQRLRDTFPLGDLIIDFKDTQYVDHAVERFFEAFFGNPFITPTRDEFFQNFALVSSLKSVDLSRQVGAVIVSPDQTVIGVGYNDVPKSGGGFYWENDQVDYRDFRLGYDSNVKIRDQIVGDLLRRLQGSWLSRSLRRADIATLLRGALYEGPDPVLAAALVTNLLEYGRVVHAEMAALSDAANAGNSTRSATIYCTTFPCHNCARQLIASGITRVVYIEPYSKSQAQLLYPDSVVVDGYTLNEAAGVKFESFSGISPNKYKEIFSHGKRKTKDGKVLEWNPSHAEPIIESFFAAYIWLEAQASELLELEITSKSLWKPAPLD